ncbi:DEAD/DEAH box helicase, putative [Eimeria acervulina]|uniref:DEAD/DEAH box helicase, putative n=1 Tax=Eimeria acervulina TaxID=5801 RepID=U6GC39_EIMAC|nr:DEAD/DEAH box helicase, putative [Eimeria acervulina]CDI77700.1 DEAD/DEAH box helicase, putative [Eimeria acervulina]
MKSKKGAPRGPLGAPKDKLAFLLSSLFAAAVSLQPGKGPSRLWGPLYPKGAPWGSPPSMGLAFHWAEAQQHMLQRRGPPEGPLTFVGAPRVTGGPRAPGAPSRATKRGSEESANILQKGLGGLLGGPLGGPPGGPQGGAPGAPEAEGLLLQREGGEGLVKPLFPELQTAPQSTAHSEISGTKFKDIPEILPEIAAALEKRGITHMTNIQATSFKPIFEGVDLLGRSETGSGKTFAFLVPLLSRLLQQQQPAAAAAAAGVHAAQAVARPRLLVLAPTRELARQVHSELEALGGPLGFSSLCIYGGVPLQQQLRQIRLLCRPQQQQQQQQQGCRKGLDAVVATPGRLIDLMGLGPSASRPGPAALDLSGVMHVVLDEADEMLRFGFAEAVDLILSSVLSSRVLNAEGAPPAAYTPQSPPSSGFEHTPQNNTLMQQQLLLFSATQPNWVQKVAEKFLKNPQTVDAMLNRTVRTASSVRHLRMEVPSDCWGSSLSALLQGIVLCFCAANKQAIVFVATKTQADALAHESAAVNFSAAVLHGGVEQQTREAIMHAFKKGRYKTLICTDVAARGVDLGNVDLVVHCGVAHDSDVFVHRSGRTGRAGREGLSLLLHSPEERREVRALEANCGIRFEYKELPSVNEVLEATSASTKRQLDDVHRSVLPVFLSAAEDLLQRAEREGVQQQEVLARALAVAAGLKELPSRSLLTWRRGDTTLHLKKRNEWQSAQEAEDW